jgi:hypothetical protein
MLTLIHVEGFTPQPISSVTAIIDDLDDLVAALESLQQSGFSAERHPFSWEQRV